MNTADTYLLYIGVFFIFILISGFWVSNSGKPYNSLIFNIHKLIGLGAGIYLMRAVYLTHETAPLTSAQWTSIVATGFLFIFTVAAGGLKSILEEGDLQNMPQSAQTVIKWVHKILPYFIILSTALTLMLLSN